LFLSKFGRFWLDDEKISRDMIDVAGAFLRRTGRVVSVKYYTASITYGRDAFVEQHVGGSFSSPPCFRVGHLRMHLFGYRFEHGRRTNRVVEERIRSR
jgi:hypothetical protein